MDQLQSTGSTMPEVKINLDDRNRIKYPVPENLKTSPEYLDFKRRKEFLNHACKHSRNGFIIVCGDALQDTCWKKS